ncbi:LysR family transcriptional regulator [Desulfoferrobacter suflitae]|uniref:LysR family transcriptional regulator n=1 Tax=Desulfoferrobacter suflitae TaxID=2865782 RepID=UPI002164521A|nr:LysR family transcriptional regulator [Desulfoferrobacter suflitae]MCK8602587.1 LysR family transcriptional regulator [Desulfoferrobacter suflitae]
MEWQQLTGFYHVARLKSFTRAAKATFRTQSALSQQIKALEEELDCQLFERVGKRRISLTAAGEILYHYAESVLHGHAQLVEQLHDIKKLPKGPLKIAAPFTTLYHLLPERLSRYMQRYPEVELTLLDRPQESALELLKQGEIDLCFALESLVPKSFTSVRWLTVETVLMVPQGHPLARLERVTFDRLARYPLIMPPKHMRTGCRQLLERELARMKMSCRIIMESSNVELSSIYVELGLGISFATVVRDLPVLRERRLEFLALDHYFQPDHICIVTRVDKKLLSYQQDFVNMLMQESNSCG